MESFANRSEAIHFIISKMDEFQKRKQIEIIQAGMDYTTYPSMSGSFGDIDISSAGNKEIDDYLSFHLQADKPDYFGGFNKINTPDISEVYFESKKLKQEFEKEVSNASDMYAIVFFGDGTSFYRSNQKDFIKFFTLEFFQYFRPSELKAFIEFADGYSDIDKIEDVIDEEEEKKNCQKFKKFGDILRCIQGENDAVFTEKDNMYIFDKESVEVLPDENEAGYSSDLPESTGMKRTAPAEITPEQEQKRYKAMLAKADRQTAESRRGKYDGNLANDMEKESQNECKDNKSKTTKKKDEDETYDDFPMVSECAVEKKKDEPKKPTIVLKKMKSSTLYSKQMKNTKFAFHLYIGHPIPQKTLEDGSVSFKVVVALRDIDENKPLSAGFWLFKPEYFSRAMNLCWCASDEVDYQIKIGSSTELTWAICKSFMSNLTLRAAPSIDGNEGMQYRGGKKPNGGHYMNDIEANAGVYEFTARNSKASVCAELEKMHNEVQNILHSDEFYRVYKMAAFWAECNPEADANTVYGQILNANNENQFILDAAVAKSFEKYHGSLSFSNSTKSKQKKVFFHHVVDDNGVKLRNEIKNYNVVMHEKVPLDELFMNTNIIQFVSSLMGIYSEKFAKAVFADPETSDKSFLPSAF